MNVFATTRAAFHAGLCEGHHISGKASSGATQHQRSVIGDILRMTGASASINIPRTRTGDIGKCIGT
jgi:hypothetical protein